MSLIARASPPTPVPPFITFAELSPPAGGIIELACPCSGGSGFITLSNTSFFKTFEGSLPYFAAQLAEKYGRDPSKVLKKEVLDKVINPLPPEQGQANSMIPPAGGDNSANVIKGGTGVGGEALAMRDIMNQVNG